MLLFVELHVLTQVLVFTILSAIGAVLTRFYFIKNPIQSDQPFLNMRGSEYVGRVFKVVDPIEDGIGRVKIGDSYWRVEGADCAEGTQVRVIAVDGAQLRVEIVENQAN